MKLYNILLLFCFALLLTSCFESQPEGTPYDDLICVINSDGTGFKRLHDTSILPFSLSQLWDLAVTQDGKLIFGADRYYISDPDTLNLTPFSDLLTDSVRKISLSKDNQAYYCNNGDLYQFNLSTNITSNLTQNISGNFKCPIVSSDNSIITLFSIEPDSNATRRLCYFKLSNDSIYVIPEAGTRTNNGLFNPLDHKIYHEQNEGLYKINLDGTANTLLLSYASFSKQAYGINFFNDHIITIDFELVLRIFDINTNNTSFVQQLNGRKILAKNSKIANRIFFVYEGDVNYYDIDLQLVEKVTNIIGDFSVMCPTWDGSKIYFIAYMRVN
jgi:hypothetical protein